MNFFINIYRNICDFFGYQPDVIYEALKSRDRIMYYRAWHVPTNTFGYGKDKTEAFNEMSYNLNNVKKNREIGKDFHGWS